MQTFLAAYFLLNCGKGEFSTNTDIKNSDICQILRVGDRTIDLAKKKFIEGGFLQYAGMEGIATELRQKDGWR